MKKRPLFGSNVLLVEGPMEWESGMFLDLRHQIISCAEAGPEDINFFIDSPGGDVEPTLALVDLMKAIPNRIIGLAAGACHSSAITLLQGCDLRLSLPNSQFLAHLVYGEMNHVSPSTVSRTIVAARLEQMNQLYERVAELYAKRSGKGLEEMKKLMSEGDVTETPLFAQAALEVGLLDEIVEIPPFLPFGPKAPKAA